MLFSVIVPIYKVEKYLKRCIDSVLSQSCRDFELILVDDGSPDHCPEICDAYAAAHPNVKVVHKENGGLVSARQAGIKAALGEYVFNLDGDDAIVPDTFEHAKCIILETGADIISFSYAKYYDGKTENMVNDVVPVGLYNKDAVIKEIYPHILADKNMKHLFYFLAGKAVKRTLLTPHQLNVSTKISLGEDISCLFPCYLDAESVYIDDAPIYLYTARDDSLSNSFNTKQITQLAEVIKGFEKITSEKSKDFDEQISRYCCYMCFAILASAAEGGHIKYLDEIRDLMLGSIHKNLIKKAEFDQLTPKSKIVIRLMKKERIRTAFYVLYFAGKIKSMLKKV